MFFPSSLSCNCIIIQSNLKDSLIGSCRKLVGFRLATAPNTVSAFVQPGSKWPEVSRGHAEDGKGGEPYRRHSGNRRGRYGGQRRGGRPRGQRQRGGAVGRPGAVVWHAVSARTDLGSASSWLVITQQDLKNTHWSWINTHFCRTMRHTCMSLAYKKCSNDFCRLGEMSAQTRAQERLTHLCVKVDDIVTGKRAQFWRTALMLGNTLTTLPLCSKSNALYQVCLLPSHRSCDLIWLLCISASISNLMVILLFGASRSLFLTGFRQVLGCF